MVSRAILDKGNMELFAGKITKAIRHVFGRTGASQNGGVILFLHIPKCAGNTIYSLFREQYPRESVYIPRKSPEENARLIAEMPGHERRRVRVVAAHMPYGAHQYFPDARYITVLRDPVDRVISSYYFSLGNPNDLGHKMIKEMKLDLAGFACLPELYNLQTRYLMKHDFLDKTWFLTPPEAGITENDMAGVKGRLDRFALVGIVEEMPAVLRLMEIELGMSGLQNRFRNQNENRSGVTDVDEGTLDLIRQANRHDTEIYEYTKRLFVESCVERGVTFSNSA